MHYNILMKASSNDQNKCFDCCQSIPGADPEILKKADANLTKCGMLLLLYLHDHTSKKGKIESTPLYLTFKLTKQRKM